MADLEYRDDDVVAFAADLERAYGTIGRTPDVESLIWVARMQFDAITIGYEAARAKQLAAAVQALTGAG